MSKPFLKKFAGLTLALIMVFSVGYTYAATTIYPANFTDPVYDTLTSGSVNSTLWYSGASNVTDLMNYPQGSYSYIIFTDGVTVYAKNGTTGKIDYSGTATTVIQSVIDAISRGIILIKAGTYNNVTITLKSYITLKGEGMFQTFLENTNTSQSIIAAQYDIATSQEFIGIENLSVQNGSRSILISYCSNSWFKNVRAVYATSDCIAIDHSYGCLFENVYATTSLAANGFNGNSINNVVLIGLNANSNAGSGIIIKDTEALDMINCDASCNSGYGLYLQGVVGSKISGYYEGNLGGNNIYIAGGTDWVRNKNLEIGPLWVDGTGVSGDTGIEVTKTDGIQFKSSCYFQQLSTDIAIAGTVGLIKSDIKGNGWNIYWGAANNTFTPDNSGSLVNTTATTFVFAHGCAGTLTGLWCSFNDTGITGYSWVNTNATAITVTIQGTPAGATPFCYWTGEYKP